VDIELVYPDEPGSINGTVVDSFCLSRAVPARLRLRADSLRALLAPPDSATAAAGAELTDSGVWEEWTRWAEDTLGVRPDSLDPREIEERLAGLAGELEAALDDSAYCARPVWVEAFPSPDSSASASVRVSDAFDLKGLAPGEYWLRAYRDLNLSGDLAGGEPAGAWMGPYTIEPVHSIDSLQVLLPALAKPWPPELFPPPGAAPDSTPAGASGAVPAEETE
jgi:hypothetical protein